MEIKESPEIFENRKREHIRWALDPRNEAQEKNDFDAIDLVHEALPDLNFEEVRLNCLSLGLSQSTPFSLSSMTAGHADSGPINLGLAEACSEKNWMMGLGSQRKEIADPTASQEWKNLRQRFPGVRLLGNIGISQLIASGSDPVLRLAEACEASAMIIHLNALQECLQNEGTPQFRGGLDALAQLKRKLSIPLIVKETGCGMSQVTLQRLVSIGVDAIDVAGLGGTHWGRIEGCRATDADPRRAASEVFKDWGVTTIDSLKEAQSFRNQAEIWASGGVRSGLDAAKALAMGAKMVGLAKPLLSAFMDQGVGGVVAKMEQMEFELKVALFCTGCEDLNQLQEKRVWQCRKT